MSKQHMKYLAAFIAGGFLFAPFWGFAKSLVGR